MSETEMTDLLPCPFCGNYASIQGDGDKFYAVCSNVECFAAVGEAYDRDAMPDHIFREKDDVIKAWNTRAPQHEKAGDGIQSATMPECEELIFKICQLLGCRQPTPTTACAINALLTSRLNAPFIAGSQRTEAERKALREAIADARNGGLDEAADVAVGSPYLNGDGLAREIRAMKSKATLSAPQHEKEKG